MKLHLTWYETNSIQAKNDQASTAIAYQIAFDLYDNGTQEFLAKVIRSLPKKTTEAEASTEEREWLLSLLFKSVTDLLNSNRVRSTSRGTK